MKFQIPSDIFAKALTLVNKSISHRALLPVLSGVLLHAEDSFLTLIGSNSETALRVRVPISLEREGTFLVPARLLTDFVLNISSPVLMVEGDDHSLSIVAGSISSNFALLPVADYPHLPFDDHRVSYTLPSKDILDALDRVCFSASTDESRAILTGVSLHVEKGALEMAATDGFRLSVEHFSSHLFEKNFHIVIPSKIFNDVGKILREYSGNNAGNFTCSVSKEGSQVVFDFPNSITFITRTLEGAFPQYKKIIPTSYSTRVIFQTDELFKMVRAGSLFARSGNSVIKLSINSDDQVVRLSSATEQVGNYSAELSSRVEGSSSSICFNSRYLLDFLGKAREKEVIFEMNGSLQPGVWRLPNNSHYLHVVMPVRSD